MSLLQRMGGFALVPLSVLPLVGIAPAVEPSVVQRIHELRGDATPAHHRSDRLAPARTHRAHTAHHRHHHRRTHPPRTARTHRRVSPAPDSQQEPIR